MKKHTKPPQKPPQPPQPPIPDAQEQAIASDFAQGILEVFQSLGAATRTGNFDARGRTKFVRIQSATVAAIVLGHCVVTGLYTNGVNIAGTTDGSTFNQVQSGVNAALDTVVFIVNNTTERNFGMINTEILEGQILTVSNNGAGDAWIMICYVPITDAVPT